MERSHDAAPISSAYDGDLIVAIISDGRPNIRFGPKLSRRLIGRGAGELRYRDGIAGRLGHTDMDTNR
jgi:hypothetical protein